MGFTENGFYSNRNVETVLYLATMNLLYIHCLKKLSKHACLYIDWNVASRQYDEFESKCDSLVVRTKRSL